MTQVFQTKIGKSPTKHKRNKEERKNDKTVTVTVVDSMNKDVFGGSYLTKTKKLS